MAKLIVISWRDIPAQVVVKKGRNSLKNYLPARFQEAIDKAAMRAGKSGSEAYIAHWCRSQPRACSDDLEAELAAESKKLEAKFSDAMLEKMVRCKGFFPGE